MEITKKFKKKYVPGFDCRLSTFRNSLASSNVSLSNSMILGLSGSLIFCFNDGKIYSRLPFFVVAGINDQSLEALAFNLNIYLLRGRMYNIEDAKVQIRKFLSMDIPLNIAINRGALQGFFDSSSGQINMGHHYITLTNYDEEQELFTIFETDSAQEIYITENQLETIWFYDLKHKREDIDPFQMCDGQWYSFFCNETITTNELIDSCYHAIYKVMLNFFNSPINTIYGISALRNFQNTVHSWGSNLNRMDELREFIHVMSAMESGMSGGGFGRKLYGYFLNEFSSMIDDKNLKNISQDFIKLGKLWRSFMQHLMHFSNNEERSSDKFSELIVQIDYLTRFEISCMEALKAWLAQHKWQSIPQPHLEIKRHT